MSVQEVRLSPFDDHLRGAGPPAGRALEQASPGIVRGGGGLLGTRPAPQDADPAGRASRPGLYGGPRGLFLGRWTSGRVAAFMCAVAAGAGAVAVAGSGDRPSAAPQIAAPKPIVLQQPAQTPLPPARPVVQRPEPRPVKRAVRKKRKARRATTRRPVRRASPASRTVRRAAPPPASNFSQEFTP